jgi:hypothetical protein
LEDFDDEEEDVPEPSKSLEGEVSEQSKSLCKSDVSCFSFCCIAVHNLVGQIRVTVKITPCLLYLFR